MSKKDQNQDKTPLPSKKRTVHPALKYSGMAMQMAVTIFIGVWLGRWLDNYLQTSKPYFTLLLAVAFLGGIMYIIIRDVSKND